MRREVLSTIALDRTDAARSRTGTSEPTWGGGKLRKPLGNRILYQAVDHRDRVEDLRLRRDYGRCCPTLFDRFRSVHPADLIGPAHGETLDIVFGELVLVDEVDPKRRHLGKAHLVGVAALLGPGEIAPNLVLEGATLSQPPLVGGHALFDMGAQSRF